MPDGKNSFVWYNARGSALLVKWFKPALPSGLNHRVFLAAAASLEIKSSLISMLIRNDDENIANAIYEGERRNVFYAPLNLS